MDSENILKINVWYDFTFKFIYNPKNYNYDNPNNPPNYAFTHVNNFTSFLDLVHACLFF